MCCPQIVLFWQLLSAEKKTYGEQSLYLLLLKENIISLKGCLANLTKNGQNKIFIINDE